MRRKAKHKGLHAARLRREPEEKRFAKAWQESNDSCRTLDLRDIVEGAAMTPADLSALVERTRADVADGDERFHVRTVAGLLSALDAAERRAAEAEGLLSRAATGPAEEKR